NRPLIVRRRLAREHKAQRTEILERRLAYRAQVIGARKPKKGRVNPDTVCVIRPRPSVRLRVCQQLVRVAVRAPEYDRPAHSATAHQSNQNPQHLQPLHGFRPPLVYPSQRGIRIYTSELRFRTYLTAI